MRTFLMNMKTTWQEKLTYEKVAYCMEWIISLVVYVLMILDVFKIVDILNVIIETLFAFLFVCLTVSGWKKQRSIAMVSLWVAIIDFALIFLIIVF